MRLPTVLCSLLCLQVYWLRARPGEGNDREYIGYTSQHPETRLAQHMVKKHGLCASWLDPCEVYGDYVVLYETGDENEALFVELLAVMWRLKSRGNMPFLCTRPGKSFGKYVGGVVRGACILRPSLEKEYEFKFLNDFLMWVEPLEEMKSDRPSTLPFGAVGRGVEWLQGLRRRQMLPLFVTQHLAKRCFICNCPRHLSYRCHLEHSSLPDAPNFLEAAAGEVSKAEEPKVRLRAPKGEGEPKKEPVSRQRFCGQSNPRSPGQSFSARRNCRACSALINKRREPRQENASKCRVTGREIQKDRSKTELARSSLASACGSVALSLHAVVRTQYGLFVAFAFRVWRQNLDCARGAREQV